MKIAEWGKNDRPRERLEKNGAEALSDAELIAILLRTGYGRGSGDGKRSKTEGACLFREKIGKRFESFAGSAKRFG